MSPTPSKPVFRFRSLFIIRGHVHRTEIERITYCNDGDWVESCTVLAEDDEGRLLLLRWTEQEQMVARTGMVAMLPIGQAA